MKTIRFLDGSTKTYDTLSGADLSGANLSGADLSGANLLRASLRRANLSGADLSGADLLRANLSGADLSGADLSGADLYGADLLRASLHRADLSGADLLRANLSGADLSGADLYGARLPPPTMMLLARWGVVSDRLCKRLMRYGASNHPDQDLFDTWANGGRCPYRGSRVQRCANFLESRRLYSKKVKLYSAYELMVMLLREKCKTDL